MDLRQSWLELRPNEKAFDEIAVDTVLGEPVSCQIPCFQGNLQGFPEEYSAKYRVRLHYPAESMRLTRSSVEIRLPENRE